MPGIWKWGLSGERDKKMMICTCSREQFNAGDGEMALSPESLTTRDISTSAFSSRTAGDAEQKQDRGNIEEAESSLREGLSLNYEEARALLGRLEYQRGNIEAALHVFEGIEVNAVIPKIRSSLSRALQPRKGRTRSETSSQAISMHVNLLLEAIFLKAKCLQDLDKPRGAAQECKTVLDIVEPILMRGIPEGTYKGSKLHELVSKAVVLLPELWKQAGLLYEAMQAYRRALLNPWALDTECSGRLKKDFAILLLYSGVEVGPPSLGSQTEGSYIPRNNIEEAILLLMIVLRKISLNKIPWDPTIMDHLTFALAMSGQLGILASQVEELYPGIYERTERWYTLSLCYSSEGKDDIALNLLRMVLNPRAKPNFIPALLFATKLTAKSSGLYNDGILFARRALSLLENEDNCMTGIANFLLGVVVEKQSVSAVSETERVHMQDEAHCSLEKAISVAHPDPNLPLSLSLLNAEKRNLDVAFQYAKKHLDIEGGTSSRGWRLLALILSAQQQFHEAESVMDVALDQTGKWEQGEMLRTKAKLQVSQGKLKDTVRTYGKLFALVQAQKKSFASVKPKFYAARKIELEAWQDLAYFYIDQEKWNDAGVCLDKAKCIKSHSARTWHARGALYQAQGCTNQAMNAFLQALAVDSENVDCLISLAELLIHQGERSLPVSWSLLTNALKLDRNNHKAWYNLAIVHKLFGNFQEAVDCFQAAHILEQITPVESFHSV